MSLDQVIGQIKSKNSILDIINSADVLYKGKDEIYEMLEYMNINFIKSRNIKLINCIKIVEDTKKRLKSNANYDMSIDNMLLNIWEEVNEKDNRG
jgi:thermostable 8-oxoguanine DNA glycosylase